MLERACIRRPLTCVPSCGRTQCTPQVKPNTITLAWTPPAQRDDLPPIEEYEVTYTETPPRGTPDDDGAVDPEPVPRRIRTRSTEPTFTIGSGDGAPASEPLAPGTRVSDIGVAAVSGNGVGHVAPVGDGGDVTTTALPHAPSEPRVTEVTPTTVKLEWDAPADTGGKPIKCYRIRMKQGEVSSACVCARVCAGPLLLERDPGSAQQ